MNSLLKPEQLNQLSLSDTVLKEQIDRLEGINAGFLTITASNYPHILTSSLKNSAPPVITYMGNLNILQMDAVGFCGSRKASDRGLDVAKDCASQLANEGIAIVSGHAAGVDQQTHYAALETGGSTIIVLPEGLLNFRRRKILDAVWDYDRVLVISEFAPNARWTASRAMQRNKTIIALSKAMILIEAGKRGGSMDAGKKTLAMKKMLYAPVYEGMPDFAVGNQILLQQGAVPLMRNKNTGKASLTKLINSLKSNEKPLHNKQLGLL